jgi:ketosteroid isomerase-like protein
MQTTPRQGTAADLERFITDFYAAIEEERFESVTAVIDPDIQQLDERSGTWVRDQGSVMKSYVEEVASADRYRNWVEDLNARLLGDDVGLATFIWHADAAWAGVDYRIRCPSTIVARWTPAGWRIVLVHSVPADDKSAS